MYMSKENFTIETISSNDEKGKTTKRVRISFGFLNTINIESTEQYNKLIEALTLMRPDVVKHFKPVLEKGKRK